MPVVSTVVTGEAIMRKGSVAAMPQRLAPQSIHMMRDMKMLLVNPGLKPGVSVGHFKYRSVITNTANTTDAMPFAVMKARFTRLRSLGFTTEC